jgi:hypothetical protein
VLGALLSVLFGERLARNRPQGPPTSAD